jgi:NAD-dependent SIR2 family protein deacetylase
VGSGMTASGGLNYADRALAEKWYPEYYTAGKRSIIEIMSGFWPTDISERSVTAFWGFWARHIWHIRYEPEALPPYHDLFRLIGNKEYFICSTNVDGQLEKAGFNRRKIFAPQGDYALFQCAKPCSQDVVDNKEQIVAMLANMVSPVEICVDDIPRCPRCGGFMTPNLRCDHRFVGTPHVQNVQSYKKFLSDAYNKNLVLLELGVGFNTPGIIRYPFEAIALKYPNSTLIRINRYDDFVLDTIADKSVSIKQDVGNALHGFQYET